jgi:hypothetical protein
MIVAAAAAQSEADCAWLEEAFIQAVNNLNNTDGKKIAVSHYAPCPCAANGSKQENSRAVFREADCSRPADASIHAVNNMNKAASDKITVSLNLARTCVADGRAQENSRAVFKEPQPLEPWVDPVLDSGGPAGAAAYSPCPSSISGARCV